MGVGSFRVSADRLPMVGDDTAGYWGIGGGTASAANRSIERPAAKPDEKPQVGQGPK
jgi:hypothetical protein